jgi:hypothetical protein
LVQVDLRSAGRSAPSAARSIDRCGRDIDEIAEAGQSLGLLAQPQPVAARSGKRVGVPSR